MANQFDLKYFTTGDSKESLKRKVFCAYHPKDVRMLDEIFRDLSEACACTMFYYEPGKEPEDEAQLEADLKTMNLFVLIVTTDFLLNPCFANSLAVEIAAKYAIPVLPILFEGGLEEVFNEKIGNLQCLSKVLEKIDATTVPYREKLSNFLSQTLSSHIDVKRCAAAFDTSIFLSYRKKDRKYAQRLMELIHEDPACRNIAIWYDEFLVPGEDFNDGIKAELEDSAIFVLVVTPHIVEGDNYITLTEYPMATSLNKAVLPFELVQTDAEKLKVFCPGIKTPVKTEQGEQVRTVILNTLQTLGITPRESTAERNFLIGLAYLKGICVEKNSAIGVSLITEAAEADVRDAVKTLAMLYRNGEGIKRDMDAAILWQSRLVEMDQQTYSADPCEENAQGVVKAYFTLAELQSQNKEYSQARKTYLKTITFCQNDTLADTLYGKEHAAMAFELMGKLWVMQGKYQDAQHGCFQGALDLRIQLHDLYPSIKTTLELIEAHESIGECCEAQDDTVGVKTQVLFAKKLIAQVDRIDARADNYDLVKRLMLCKNRLGHLYNVLNAWEEAMFCIGDGVRLAEKLSKISDTAESKRQLMLAYINDGDQHARCNVENHYKAAMQAYREAYLIVWQQWAQKQTLETQMDLATVEAKLGYVNSKLGFDKLAMAHYDTALTNFRAARSIADTIPVKRKLSQCCAAAANVCRDLDDEDGMLALLWEGVNIGEDMVKRSGLLILRTELANAYCILGSLLKDRWEEDQALECLRRSHELLKEAWILSGRLKALRAYANNFKEVLSAAKLAGDFDLVNTLRKDLQKLYDEYQEYL